MKYRLNWRQGICVFFGFWLGPLVLAWWGDLPSPGERAAVAGVAGGIGAAIGIAVSAIWGRLENKSSERTMGEGRGGRTTP